MKRQIIHQKCFTPHNRQDFLSYAGEREKTIGGFSLRNCICDLCGEPIHKDEFVYAQSYGLNSQPYYSWEEKYIQKEAK